MSRTLGGAVSIVLHVAVLSAPWLLGLTFWDPSGPSPDVAVVALAPAPPVARPRVTSPPSRAPVVTPPRVAVADAIPSPVPAPPAAVALATIPAPVPSVAAPPPAAAPPPSADEPAIAFDGVGLDDPPPARPLADDESAGELLARLREVTERATVSARAAGKPFVGRREVFAFLLDHPELATQLTQALRVARYRVWRTAEGLVLDDGWGARLRFSILAPSSNTRIVYAEGRYEQTLLPDIPGQAVVMIEFDAAPAPDGRDVLSTAVTSYVKVDSAFASFLVRLAGSTVLRKAELEAQRLVRVFARVSQKIDEDPHAAYARLRDRPDVPPEHLEAFRRLLRLP